MYINFIFDKWCGKYLQMELKDASKKQDQKILHLLPYKNPLLHTFWNKCEDEFKMAENHWCLKNMLTKPLDRIEDCETKDWTICDFY